MERLGATVARLASTRGMSAFGKTVLRGDRLTDLIGFGSNPGTLKARAYVPANLPENAPLVVVLHGCTQTAAAYDICSGWSALADDHGFALLYPEQQRSNNANLCFNWFSLADARRGGGEALSIRQMIDALVIAYKLDTARIFVTGLSAGGAMASIMLATYPEVFAGGAIIAGLPYGNANSVGDAFARMRGRGYASDIQLGTLVTSASEHKGPWPKISVWHGTADTTVDPSNALRIVDQWRAVHGLQEKPSTDTLIDSLRRQTWRDAAGTVLIETNSIAAMAHGTPLDTVGPDACGTPGPFMLDVGISSTRQIARFFGIVGTDAGKAQSRISAKQKRPDVPRRPYLLSLPPESRNKPSASPAPPVTGVQAIIENAFRAAGLMK